MDYIEQIFSRANLQQLRNFLISGAEDIELSDKSYSEREKDAFNTLEKELKKMISDKKTVEDILLEFDECMRETNNIYMEIGLQCGFMLAAQLSEK